MLMIRKEQIKAFARVREEVFEKRAVIYLQEHFPEKCSKLGHDELFESVRTAMDRRDKYRFRTEEMIFAYLDLMYTLGFHFENDEQYNWAQEILEDKDLGPRTRMALVRQRAETGMERTPQGEAAK